MNNFQIFALNHDDFKYLDALSDEELVAKDIRKIVVDEFPGFPCRTTLEDAEIGEEVYLLNVDFHQTNSPYKANGPVFIRKNKSTKNYKINEIPLMFHHRLLSLRGYDKSGMMKMAEVFNGEILKEKITEFLENPEIEYLHIHNARPGCYNCLVKRA